VLHEGIAVGFVVVRVKIEAECDKDLDEKHVNG
jgi:hypothetical protein